MNERIKELLEQAGVKFVVMPKDTVYEKFAELIVQECIQVCADRGTHHDGLYSAWADDCSKRIGKHFGVEE